MICLLYTRLLISITAGVNLLFFLVLFLTVKYWCAYFTCVFLQEVENLSYPYRKTNCVCSLNMPR